VFTRREEKKRVDGFCHYFWWFVGPSELSFPDRNLTFIISGSDKTGEFLGWTPLWLIMHES
jgi:hypothetical protein